ncbi:PAS domain-containing protein [Streptomyces sp. NBC_00370]|uniref:PAS domain-containing protein n=1 Tax=Streptomyces sp. NBC_00370 TaxID=2975728 RepID=UPI003FA7C122
MAVFDVALRLRRANGYAERTLNVTEDDFRGLRHRDFLPLNSEVRKVERALSRVMETCGSLAKAASMLGPTSYIR